MDMEFKNLVAEILETYFMTSFDITTRSLNSISAFVISPNDVRL